MAYVAGRAHGPAAAALDTLSGATSPPPMPLAARALAAHVRCVGRLTRETGPGAWRVVQAARLTVPQAPPPLQWSLRGPPAGAVHAPANSWLYVPLLQAAAGAVGQAVVDSWRRDERASGWWDAARLALAAAAPVPVDELVSVVLMTMPHS